MPSDQQTERANQWDWILGVIGGGTGVVMMAIWGLLMFSTAPNEISDIFVSGAVFIIPYGLFITALMVLHRHKTSGGKPDAQ